MPKVKKRQTQPLPRQKAWREDLLGYAGDCQAKRVIMRFGGVKPMLEHMLAAGVRRTAQSVYLWLRTGGLIPPNGVRDIFLAESQAGIRLTDADWSPYVLVEVEVPPPESETPQTASLPQSEAPVTAPRRWEL